MVELFQATNEVRSFSHFSFVSMLSFSKGNYLFSEFGESNTISMLVRYISFSIIRVEVGGKTSLPIT